MGLGARARARARARGRARGRARARARVRELLGLARDVLPLGRIELYLARLHVA